MLSLENKTLVSFQRCYSLTSSLLESSNLLKRKYVTIFCLSTIYDQYYLINRLYGIDKIHFNKCSMYIVALNHQQSNYKHDELQMKGFLFLFFCNKLYSLLSFGGPQLYNSKATPFTYLVCCYDQNQLTNFITR